MARRSDHTPEELKKLSIDKGIGIIDKKGLSGFSARKVAAAMGYTVGTLYHIFGSKDQFLLHIHGRIMDEWYDDLVRGLSETKQEPLRYLAQAYAGFARVRPHRWRALFDSGAESVTPPAWYGEKIVRHFRLVEEALLPHVGGDAARARRAAKIIWAGVHGICVLALSGKLDLVGAERTETLAEGMIDVCLRGLGRE